MQTAPMFTVPPVVAAKVGDLASYETCRALVPCKVTSVHVGEYGVLRATATVTADRPGYHRGEIITGYARDFIPRPALYRSRQACGQYRIRPFSWAE